MTTVGDTINTIYNDSANFGRVMTRVGSVVIGLIMTFVFIVGVKMATSHHSQRKTSGVVTVSSCERTIDGSWLCDVTVQYTVDGKSYTGRTSANPMNPSQVDVGKTVSVLYDVGDPTQITINSVSKQTLGLILVGISVGVMLLVWGVNYIVTKSRFAASASGFRTAFHLL
jgi:hypothetical protein